MSTKTVSVVMTTYNGELFLREQLDSILCQTYPIHELIVQDDCSTDNTVEIIKEYATRHPFIKLYVNEHNLGFNKNFKTAVMKATGDYVAIADQDDIWFPEKIEKQVQAMPISINTSSALKISCLPVSTDIRCSASDHSFKMKNIGFPPSGTTGAYLSMLTSTTEWQWLTNH